MDRSHRDPEEKPVRRKDLLKDIPKIEDPIPRRLAERGITLDHDVPFNQEEYKRG